MPTKSKRTCKKTGKNVPTDPFHKSSHRRVRNIKHASRLKYGRAGVSRKTSNKVLHARRKARRS